MIWIKRLLSTFRSSSADKRLELEFAAHLTALEEEFRRQGLDASEARRAAQRVFGPTQQLKEQYRERRGLMPVEQFGHDLRYAFRNLRRSPGFALIALLSLALGIGVNSAIFTMLNGLVLKTLPVPHPERLVQVEVFNGPLGEYENFFSYPFYRDLIARNTVFAEVTAQFGFSLFELQFSDRRERVNGVYVSGSYFEFLHAAPYLGRLLNTTDDGAVGANPICVLSYQLWRTKFGGNPHIIGTTIPLNNKRVEVVGVSRPEFTGLSLQDAPDLELPLSALDTLAQSMHRDDPDSGWLQIIGHLRPGVSQQEASERVTALGNRIAQALSHHNPAEGHNRYRLKPAPQGFDEQAGMVHPLTVLMSTVSVVLLIACLNLANLLLARGQARERETAMRISLGANRWRVARLFLLESAYLAVGGALAGLTVAHGLVWFLLAEFNKGKIYGRVNLSLDLRVIFFTAIVAGIAMLLFSSVPIWMASTVQPGQRLQGTSKGVTSQGGTARLRRSLLLLQVTFTMVLLFAAGLFGRSLHNLRTINIAEDPDHLVLAEINLLSANGKLYAPESVLSEIEQRVRQMPFVASTAFGFPSSLSGALLASTVKIPGRRSLASSTNQSFWAYISPHYFQTLRTPLLTGRDFTSADRKGSAPVVIVNKQFARTYFPNQDPLGKQFTSGWDSAKLLTIIGVSQDLPLVGLTEEPKAIVYQPMLQSPSDRQVLTIRVLRNPDAFQRQLTKLIHNAIPAMPLQPFQTMAIQRDASIAQQRMLALLSSTFGALALTLSAVGLYGLVSYSAARRTREIGIRVSVGAKPTDILSLFLREHLTLVFGGTIIGSLLAFSLDHFVSSLLYGIPRVDLPSFFGAAAILFMIAAVATIVPATRASHVNPTEALRSE